MNSTLVFSAGLYSADTEVFKTSSGALKKVTTKPLTTKPDVRR